MHLRVGVALAARLARLRAHLRRVLLGLAVDDLDRPLVEHRHRPDLDLDGDLVGIVALAIEHLRARNTGRDALDIHQRVIDLVDGSIDLERVLEVHIRDARP